LHEFSELEAWRVVFPRAARSVANRSVASPYVGIGNASTARGNAAILGSAGENAGAILRSKEALEWSRCACSDSGLKIHATLGLNYAQPCSREKAPSVGVWIPFYASRHEEL